MSNAESRNVIVASQGGSGCDTRRKGARVAIPELATSLVEGHSGLGRGGGRPTPAHEAPFSWTSPRQNSFRTQISYNWLFIDNVGQFLDEAELPVPSLCGLCSCWLLPVLTTIIAVLFILLLTRLVVDILYMDAAPAHDGPLKLEGSRSWRRGEMDEDIDALPYIDMQGVSDQSWKKEVERMLADEMKKSTKKPADYLAELPPAPRLNFEVIALSSWVHVLKESISINVPSGDNKSY
jgi:hypothetical protein